MSGIGTPSDTAQHSNRQSAAAPPLLSAAQASEAAAWNNSNWNDEFSRQIIAFLRGAADGSSATFTPADVQRVAHLQEQAGTDVDGLIGPVTTAVLLHAGLSLTHPPVETSAVILCFYPGELEDLATWRERVDAVLAGGGGYRDVQPPPGCGRLYVQVSGRLVATYAARGGPPISVADGADHSADPTAYGVFALGAGHPIVTSSWPYSQIPWGAEIRRVGDHFQYRPEGAADWSWASGPHCTLRTPLDADDFDDLPQGVRDGQACLVWNKNDFGRLGWRLQGTADFIHTTPATETATTQQRRVELAPSHGCIHVVPAERDQMMARGYLQEGVKIDVKAYHEHLLPERLRGQLTTGNT
jgi:hypothetical protein